MELVQASQMIEKCFQRLGNGKKLQEAVNDDVKDRQEAQAHITEVNWQVLRLELHGRVDLFCEAFKVQLLWIFLVKEEFRASLRDPFRRYLIIKPEGGAAALVPCGNSCACCASHSAASAQARSPSQNR